MKHSKFLLLTVAALSLSGCDFINGLFGKKDDKKDDEKPARKYPFAPEIEGGTEEDKVAILEALNYTGVCNYNKKEIEPEAVQPLDYKNGKYVEVFKSVKIDDSHIVKCTWSVPDGQEYFAGWLDHPEDPTIQYLEINYKMPETPAEEDTKPVTGNLRWVLEKIECNEAKAEPDYEFGVSIKNSLYWHQEESIAELYAINDEPLTITYEETKQAKYASTFNICNYAAPAKGEDGKYPAYQPGFIPNNPNASESEAFRYLHVYGKCFYYAPDGNFALMANGKDVLEFFAGSGDGVPLHPSKYPHMNEGYINVYGTMSQYCGNMQLSYVTQILGVSATEKQAKIVEPTLEYEPLDEERLASLQVEGFTCEKQAVQMDGHGFHNSLRSVTGTYKSGSLKNKDGTAIAPSAMENGKGKRYTFVLTVGNQEVTVAYDYHTDQDDSVGLFNNLKTALTNGGEMTIKGTMRYSGFGEKSGALAKDWLRTEGNTGVWTIVPFLGNHVA
jgi:hypothetical protein